MTRRLAKAQKVIGYSCTGQLTLNKVTSFFIKKLSEDMKAGRQTACTIISKLNDSNSDGSERVVIKNAVFDELIIANWLAKMFEEEQVSFTKR